MTTKINLPADQWTEIVPSVDASFLLENPTMYTVVVYIGATAPTMESAYHKLLDTEAMTRTVGGKVYARPERPGISLPVIVSV